MDKATSSGMIAILLWSTLALLTVYSAPLPPLFLNGVCFAIGGISGLFWAARRGGLAGLRAVSLWDYAFLIIGLFGYHLAYFIALRNAPPAQAGLIAYLWPLLIVLFSGLLPGERLRLAHILGAFLGFAGAALLIAGRGIGGVDGTVLGYGAALLCALIWSSYSVFSRTRQNVPTIAISIGCLGASLISFLLHPLFETLPRASDPTTWLAVLGLGLGPLGLAFFLWDIGMKRGKIQLLGVASYGAPLLSTALLIIAGEATADFRLIVAAILIALGALIAARASLR